MKLKFSALIALLLAFCLVFCSCDLSEFPNIDGVIDGGNSDTDGDGDQDENSPSDGDDQNQDQTPDDGTPDDGTPDDGTPDDGTPDDGTNNDGTNNDGTNNDGTTPDDGEDNGGGFADGGSSNGTGSVSEFDLSLVPKYSGTPYYIINNNVPFFTEDEKVTVSYEEYGALDSLGRCTYAVSCIGTDLMPTIERGDIDSVKPSGWVQAKYDCISGKYLYNRCHLIGWQLTGEDANRSNLITGTKYMNQAMIPFENMVDDYVEEYDHHVMYRVTPIFYGNNLLCSGVLVEAYSVEDDGEGICFNLFFYNVQPEIKLNYANGASEYVGPDGDTGDMGNEGTETPDGGNTETPGGDNTETPGGDNTETPDGGNTETPDGDNTDDPEDAVKIIYVINKNSGKVHIETCSSAKKMKEENKITLELTEAEFQALLTETNEDGSLKYSVCLTCDAGH